MIGHGANLVTGDYSRGAAGFAIRGGELAEPVSEITVAGNLRDMFLHLTPANDLTYRFSRQRPDGRRRRHDHRGPVTLPWTSSRAADLALLQRGRRRGGAGSRSSYFRRDPQVWEKEGGSPVSEADLAVDKRLAEILLGERPDYGWLSEETADSDARLGRERVFVVDPIDGTRAFLDGPAEWTISLAVVEAGRPVVGGAGRRRRSAVHVPRHCRGGRLRRRRSGSRRASRETLAGARFASSRRYASAVVARGQGRKAPLRRLARLPDRAGRRRRDRCRHRQARRAGLGPCGCRSFGARSRGAARPARWPADCATIRRDTAHPTLIAANPALFGDVVELVERVDGEPR